MAKPTTKPLEAIQLTTIDGIQCLRGLRASLAWLVTNKETINELNVFPVPDGDTGSNMYLTLKSAVEAAEKAEEPSSASSVMSAAAHGSLMGARGNSGVILSQILRGFSQGLGGKRTVDANQIALAFDQASTVAYKAVIKPTEGTVLSVVRAVAESALEESQENNDLRTMMVAVVESARVAVQKTTEQLAVLQEAQVVDAGGFGLFVILEGFSHALEMAGNAQLAPTAQQVTVPTIQHPKVTAQRHGAAAVAEKEEGWGYCTEFMVNGPLDFEKFRTTMGLLGESTLVVGDDALARVHIHTFEPASLLARAATFGQVSKIKVENMTDQHHEVVQRANIRKKVGVVVVAAGAGFRELCRGLGADVVVEGGQTMNPSIEDLLEGVRAVNADSVLLLPNNKNVVLTAKHAAELAEGTKVNVIPTVNMPQGISALLAFDPKRSADENAKRLAESIASVRAVEVTRAVRATSNAGRKIKKGDVLALVDDEISEVGGDETEVINRVLEKVEPRPELVTVFRGASTTEVAAEAMVAELKAANPETEFELHDGGQEHYPYVLALE